MGRINQDKKCCRCNKNRHSKTGVYCKFHQSVQYNKIIVTEDNENHFWNTHNCEICEKIVEGGDKCIDHDHDTGEYRGVLCQACNSALGRFKDNITILERAIKYLEWE